MGMLDGELASSIFDGFKGKLLTGSLRKRTVPTSGGLDRAGDPIDSASADHSFEGFIDRYSEFSHAQAGIPESDLKLCIFGKSLAAGIAPERDNIAQITGPAGSIYVGRWYQIRKAAIDPAGALWECQSVQIPEPVA